MSEFTYNIAAVERDTGLSKDVLRMWERRYGFPMPERDGNGDRLYSTEQVERLRRIKRLMDQGHRPGKLIATSPEELAPPRRVGAGPVAPQDPDSELEDLIAVIRQHAGGAYLQAMQQRLARQGLQRFVQDTVAPLAQRIGDAWEQGRIEVFEEHLFTELTVRLLRQTIAALPSGDRPRILLTTLPGEQHVLGLLMAETLFALEGAECIALGTQTPLIDIGRAAAAHQADIVGLSFSIHFPSRPLPGLLTQLRAMLPEPIELWIGGRGAAQLAPRPGVHRLLDFDDAIATLAGWRSVRHPTR
ncbi:MAG: MerR family transcriptional regulator [Candidatus Accumulibacter sp.]|uniref:MerR family transcriptional regulator n=1 Tax=Accumulibacter sp. TaxID=2053492 RepID=UPI0025E4D136|nr:MerR family transcriptional regulator [Accumulibacter sp.]MCM8599320.1 MerR family transcriptional regulator [Accumulibacter sp.]MCM8664253.1 MerR family transcriptional regulator [Accumulibacter sp.]